MAGRGRDLLLPKDKARNTRQVLIPKSFRNGRNCKARGIYIYYIYLIIVTFSFNKYWGCCAKRKEGDKKI
jgi:hypothetical protein